MTFGVFMFTIHNIYFLYPHMVDPSQAQKHAPHTLATFQTHDGGPRTCKMRSQQVEMLI